MLRRPITISAIFFAVALPVIGGNAQIANPSAIDTITLIESPGKFLQPTTSGRLDSAKFGMTRNSGKSFHEGIDIRSIRKTKTGTPLDLIFAVMPGEIVHINNSPNASSYGRYIVLKHENSGIELYTLYAHMKVFSPEIFVGKSVPAGALLGMMGTTSSVYKIPKSDAHLHFEVGMKLGEAGFNEWFTKCYGPGNAHGLWNGFNLVGADPINFFKNQNSYEKICFSRWIKSLSRDFTIRTPAYKFPNILERSPALLAGTRPKAPSGWEIDFTWFGMPLEFRPIDNPPSEIEISNINLSNVPAAKKRSVLEALGNTYKPGKTLKNYLEIIFKK